MTQYTKIINVTPTWVDLTTEATLVAGSTYLCQNVGAKELFLFEGDNQPSTTEIGVIVPKNAKQYILQKESPTKFWARINNDDVNGFSGRVVISAA